MSEATRRLRLPAPLVAAAASPQFASAVTVSAIATVMLGFAVRSTMGWAGYIAAVATLVVLQTAVLVGRRGRLEWRGLLPISLLVFVGWCAASILWSQYQWSTVGGVALQLALAFLAVGTALTRDLIQVVRAFGDVFRAVLGLSLVVEVLSGVLLDTPFPFLGVQGRVGLGGPIQGVLGSRNMLGLVALLAAVTFAIEYATRSVPRVVAATSLVAAGAMVFLSRSPVTAGVLIVAGIATVGLLGLRRVRAESRRYYQAGLLVLSLALAVVAYLGRNRLIESLNAGTEFETRYRLWHSVLNFIPLHPLEGFGWVGYWRRNLAPFFAIGSRSTGESALNAFLDVWFQTGLIGLVAFLALVLLALVRAWLTASNRRSVVHLWPALVLVVLVATAAAESALLVEYSWFTLVVCTVKAAQELSWRRALE